MRAWFGCGEKGTRKQGVTLGEVVMADADLGPAPTEHLTPPVTHAPLFVVLATQTRVPLDRWAELS